MHGRDGDVVYANLSLLQGYSQQHTLSGQDLAANGQHLVVLLVIVAAPHDQRNVHGLLDGLDDLPGLLGRRIPEIRMDAHELDADHVRAEILDAPLGPRIG